MRGWSRRRTRPDESAKPSYITADGYRRLEEEAHHLWNVERPKMARAVQVAAAEGDRSENAEYQYSKKKLFQIDRRLKFLGKRLDVLTVVSEPPPLDGRVYFGSWVTLEEIGDGDGLGDGDGDGDGLQVTYRLVGPDETDSDRGFISIESPVAKALLRRQEGDEVEVRRPRGTTRYEIVRVANEAPG